MAVVHLEPEDVKTEIDLVFKIEIPEEDKEVDNGEIR